MKPLCTIFNKINRYMEENNGNKYLTLIYPNNAKDVLK